jgi:hypothetical protein
MAKTSRQPSALSLRNQGSATPEPQSFLTFTNSNQKRHAFDLNSA